MEFQSILFGNHAAELKKEAPDFFQDLQLDYLLERILEQVNEYRVDWFYYTMPKSKELIFYRQQVGKDMESERLCTILSDFCRRLQQSRKVHNLSLKSKGEIQTATYHLQAASLYWEALEIVQKELEEVPLCSEGMKGFTEYVGQKIKQARENGFAKDLERANTFFKSLTFQLSLDQDKLMVSEYNEEQEEKKGKQKSEKQAGKEQEKAEAFQNYFTELEKLLGQEPEKKNAAMEDIFPDPLELSKMEGILIDLLRKSRPEVFQEIRAFYKNHTEFYEKTLLTFEEEIQFYLSFQRFKRKTKGRGYSMSIPNLSEKQEFTGRGVYDLALVWKQEDTNYQVISNDFTMKDKPCFFVVTGPNQGGKTTFARSMGQAVYFTMMGLPVNAEGFTMPMLQGISTHFEAEETLQSNSGKLKEEINRLIPMMARIQNRKHFIILNELFTTATTHDAMIMGRKVMESFLARECYGIYVTHIQELAEETEEIISLVAQLAPGEESKRTYRMLPMKAQGYGYSEALVKKFQLEFEDIMRRLP